MKYTLETIRQMYSQDTQNRHACSHEVPNENKARYSAHCICRSVVLEQSPTTMQCVKERFENIPATLIRFAALLARLKADTHRTRNRNATRFSIF